VDLAWDNLGEPAPEGTFRHLVHFLEQNEDNTGRHTNSLDGLPPIQTNWCPHLCHPHHFYAGCPSSHNPPNLSWLGTGTKYAGLHTRWLGYLNNSEISYKKFMYFHGGAVYAPYTPCMSTQLCQLDITDLSILFITAVNDYLLLVICIVMILKLFQCCLVRRVALHVHQCTRYL